MSLWKVFILTLLLGSFGCNKKNNSQEETLATTLLQQPAAEVSSCLYTATVSKAYCLDNFVYPLSAQCMKDLGYTEAFVQHYQRSFKDRCSTPTAPTPAGIYENKSCKDRGYKVCSYSDLISDQELLLLPSSCPANSKVYQCYEN